MLQPSFGYFVVYVVIRGAHCTSFRRSYAIDRRHFVDDLILHAVSPIQYGRVSQ